MKYSIDVYDDLIDPSVQSTLWDYIWNQPWHHVWRYPDRHLTRYVPAEGPNWFLEKGMSVFSNMHRCTLASDEDSLKSLHFPVYLLWKELNRKLGNQYKLTGLPEGMYDQETVAPPTSDPSLKQGWRVYVNAIHNYHVIQCGYVHRDNPDLLNDRYVTILYVLNTEWYPSWNAEIKYYPEDPNGSTGDHQQFSLQQRGYNIGWIDQGRIVSPKPGRLIVYDGRCLHATNSATCTHDVNYPSVKIAFRAERV
jgi:hypothetical protein